MCFFKFLILIPDLPNSNKVLLTFESENLPFFNSSFSDSLFSNLLFSNLLFSNLLFSNLLFSNLLFFICLSKVNKFVLYKLF